MPIDFEIQQSLFCVSANCQTLGQSIVPQVLISVSFWIWLKSQRLINHNPEHYSPNRKDAQGRDLAIIFGDLSQ